MDRVAGRASAPHLCKSKGKTSQQVVLSVHMDDVHGSGPRDKLDALVALLRTRLHVKFADVIGDSEVKDEYVHLWRSRVAAKGRCWVRPKQEHFRRMAELMGAEGCKSPPTPFTTNDRGEDDEGDKELDSDRHKVYRTVLGILLHIVSDRGDLSHTTRIAVCKLRAQRERLDKDKTHRKVRLGNSRALALSGARRLRITQGDDR